MSGLTAFPDSGLIILRAEDQGSIPGLIIPEALKVGVITSSLGVLA